MAITAQKREEEMASFKLRMDNIEATVKDQAKKLDRHENLISEQSLQYDRFEDEMAALQDQMKQATLEARDSAENTVKPLKVEINEGKKEVKEATEMAYKSVEEKLSINQSKLIEVLNSELAPVKAGPEAGKHPEEPNKGHRMNYAGVMAMSNSGGEMWSAPEQNSHTGGV